MVFFMFRNLPHNIFSSLLFPTTLLAGEELPCQRTRKFRCLEEPGADWGGSCTASGSAWRAQQGEMVKIGMDSMDTISNGSSS